MISFEAYVTKIPPTEHEYNQLTDEQLKKAEKITLDIISSRQTNNTNGNVTYIINWDEPYQGADVRVSLEYVANDGWYLYSHVWCRKPQVFIKTPLTCLSEDTVQKWLTDFVIKYKLYMPCPGKIINTSYLLDCLMKNEF